MTRKEQLEKEISVLAETISNRDKELKIMRESISPLENQNKFDGEVLKLRKEELGKLNKA